MNDHLADILAALWPNHKIPAPVVAELSRRVGGLPLGVEQIRAALTDYRIACGRYEQVTPDPGNIETRLRTAAFGDRKVSSPGSSEYQPTPLSGPAMTFRQFVAEKNRRGEPVHPMLCRVFTMTKEEIDRDRKARESARLASYRSRA